MEGARDDTTPWTPPAGGPPDGRTASLERGRLLDGRFRLGEHIGSGATGTVWSALDTRVGRKVALKILHPHVRDETSRERLRREARAATSGHPSLVAIHDLHEPDGLLFLSMELVDGHSLEAVLEERGPLPVDEVAVLGRDVAAALAHLHRQGLVHRDVKPGNILIVPDGSARLCDLGLSRPLAAGGTVTETRMVVGTPVYMAPEQGRGGELSPAADVYSLGLTLAKALTGRVPLSGESAVDTLVSRQRARASSVRVQRRDCPRWFARLIAAMLEPRPGDRPSARQVEAALTARRWRWRWTRRTARAAAVVAGVAAVGAAVWSLDLGTPPGVPEAVDYRITSSGAGATLEILDSGGHVVGALRTSAPHVRPETRRRRSIDVVAFGDLDGDGAREAVFADPAADPSQGLTVWRPTRGSGLELVRAIDTGTELVYDGTRFTDFRASHVECADIDHDGRDEIVLIQKAYPLYPAVVRILDGDGRTRTRLWHPGHLLNAFVADGDGDGRPDLYLAGTCNFIADDPGNESAPVVLRVEADWASPPAEISLFAPDRRLAASVPPGIELVYADLGLLRLDGYSDPWGQAYLTSLSSTGNSVRPFVASNRVRFVPNSGGPEIDGDLRSFVFDGRLRLESAVWNGIVLASLGHRPSDPELAGQLDVRYWNGIGFRTEWASVPRG